MIVIALAFMVAGIVTLPHRRSVSPAEKGAIALPPNARILEMETQADRVVLRIHTPSGDEVDIFDVHDGHLVARIRAEQPK